jgi:hypothetical protein
MLVDMFGPFPRPMLDHKKELETTTIFQLFFFRCNRAGKEKLNFTRKLSFFTR